MSTKSKTAMDTKEVEANANIKRERPARNLVPVDYTDGKTERKRGQGVKETTSEPGDKKKKKVNGNSTDDAAPKKAGKKKAVTDNGKTSEPDAKNEDEPAPAQSRKGKVAKTKTQARDEIDDAPEVVPVDDIVDEIPKPAKGKGKVKATNGEGSSASSKPTESKGAVPKASRGKKKGPVTADDAEVIPEGEEPGEEEVTTKSVPSKPAPSKTTKGKKGAKVSNDDGGDKEAVDVPVTKGKGRPKKAAATTVTDANDE